MSTNKALKIVVCGPTKGGKTSIANFIAGHSEQLGNPNMTYDPTVGASFESCWPAVMKDLDGVIIVYNPEIPTHDTEVGIWYDQFVKRQKLSDEQCQVFAHRISRTPAPRSRPPPKLAGLTNVMHTNFGSVTQILTGFEDYLRGVHQAAGSRSRVG